MNSAINSSLFRHIVNTQPIVFGKTENPSSFSENIAEKMTTGQNPALKAKPKAEAKPTWFHYLGLYITGALSVVTGNMITSNNTQGKAPALQSPQSVLVSGKPSNQSKKIYTAEPLKPNQYNIQFMLEALNEKAMAERDKNSNKLSSGDLAKSGDEDALNVALVKHTFPATILVIAERDVQKIVYDQFGRQFKTVEKKTQLGSGFFINKDGYFLTNNHVISDENRNNPLSSIKVTLLNGKTYTAKRIHNDATIDIALFKLDTVPENLPTLSIANQSEAGESVMIAGHPELNGWSAMFGKISNNDRLSERGVWHLQTDADFDSGISGGPLVNSRGQVVGINTYMTGEEMGTVRGFSIRHDVLRDYIQKQLPQPKELDKK